jgi:hypothetical protein
MHSSVMKNTKKNYEILSDGHIRIEFVRNLLQGKDEEYIRESENTLLAYLNLVWKIVGRQHEETDKFPILQNYTLTEHLISNSEKENPIKRKLKFDEDDHFVFE